MTDKLKEDELKEVVAKVLNDVDLVIGYEQGFDAIHATPYFITSADQIDRLIWNPLCVHNLTTYLPTLKKKKTGVIVKGCDSRTIVQFIQEGLVLRENMVVIGIPCRGVINVNKILRETNQENIEEVSFDNSENIVFITGKGQKTLPVADFLPDKCRTCQYPTPLVYDHLIGDPIKSDKAPGDVYGDIKKFEEKTLEERMHYWEQEFDRCIRCYACRNACPMCICSDNCIAESRDPHWMTQKMTLSEKFMFHMIHALHLAGRCVECGECERACPMGIPVNKMKRKINQDMKELYNYEPGVSLDEKPPMFMFNVDELKIKEHKI
jgi:formate dehydrogenase (coenzyme F420) beta subunit